MLLSFQLDVFSRPVPSFISLVALVSSSIRKCQQQGHNMNYLSKRVPTILQVVLSVNGKYKRVLVCRILWPVLSQCSLSKSAVLYQVTTTVPSLGDHTGLKQSIQI